MGGFAGFYPTRSGASERGDTLAIFPEPECRLLASISQFVTDQVVSNGYVGIFLLTLLGSACIPIPSEIVLLFGGALASAGFAATALDQPGAELSLIPLIAVALLGSMVGSWLSYGVGFAGGRPLVERWGRYLLLRPHEIERAHAWFERHGEPAVFFSRMIPLARAFISLPAGVARMDFGRFSLYTLLGNLPWTVGLALAGYALGEHWGTVERFLQPLAIGLGVLFLSALGWWIAKRLRSSRVEGG
jgi:membrane protein DedA with SNARE-associated domain